ncbi:hypothetical protein HN51_030505 [Arachis hypogaea]|nr:Pathogenesis-related leaf protein [Arachis hypogaea]
MKRLRKFSVVVISFISVVPLFLLAQNNPKDYLKVHNDARTRVRVQPLKWDSMLKKYARDYVNKHAVNCTAKKYYHQKYTRIIERYPKFITGAEAVANWLKTKINYHYPSNSCVDGKIFSCIPYVQIVWSVTTLLGCARVKCHHNEEDVLISCYYYPSHNFPAERPYILLE